MIATVLSYDLENDPDIVALVASSAALTLSGIPFMGPIGGARVGFINGEFVLNPTVEQMKTSDLDLVVAGTRDAVLMVESEAKELSEEKMLGAVMFGHKGFQPVIDAIIRLAERAARQPRESRSTRAATFSPIRQQAAEANLRARLQRSPARRSASDRRSARSRRRSLPASRRRGRQIVDPQKVAGAFKDLEKEIVRGNIIETGTPHRRPRPRRPSGRSSARSACFPAPMARRCSPAARPRPWW